MKTENIATAKGANLVISTKHAIEICGFIRRKSVAKMQKYLADVLDFKKSIPYNRDKTKCRSCRSDNDIMYRG